jgi:hypothetical protein
MPLNMDRLFHTSKPTLAELLTRLVIWNKTTVASISGHDSDISDLCSMCKKIRAQYTVEGAGSTELR